ncbi:MAG: ATP-binding protein [Anaerolineales bacterium]
MAWKAQPRPQFGKDALPWLLGLIALVPISIFVFTIRLPNAGALPIPDLGGLALGPLVPVFAALPWVLAFAKLGPIPGIALAALSGLFIGLLDARSPFTPHEVALTAALFILALQQRYSTRLFAWLRKPIIASLAAATIYPLLYIALGFFWVSSDVPASLDFVLSRVLFASVGMAIQLLVGTLFLVLLRSRYPVLFTTPEAADQPAPQERSIEGRLLFTLGPIVLLAFISLGGFSWWASNRAAGELLNERMSRSAQIASESLPFFLATGQNLILQLAADPRLTEVSNSETLSVLEAHLGAVPYFEQFFLLDMAGNTTAGFPVPDFAGLQADRVELEAIQLALQGISQYVAVPPLDASSLAAQLSFVVPVRNASGQVRGVLVGRTNLASNPFARPMLQSLESVNQLGGQGLLINDANRIVIAPSANSLLRPYNGRSSGTSLLYADTGPDGARRWVNYQPSTGSNWAVVAQWPARLSQQLALNTALPLLGILVLLAIAAYAVLRSTLSSVTGTLQKLIGDSKRIASGDLQVSLEAPGADEVGRLGKALEEMRRSLRSRMEEFQRLLAVSQGVASTLEVGGQIDPILEAALASGASSARLVFSDGRETAETPIGFGKGSATNKYKPLDQEVLAFTRKRDRVLITNPARARLKSGQEKNLPRSLAAFALKRNGQNLGALWLAFDDTNSFSQEITDYLEALASQAALAIDNARLFMDAKLARERTEAVLTSSPEAILVTDERGLLQIANPAALSLFGLEKGASIGKQVPQLINLQLRTENGAETSTIEVAMADGKIYQTTVTPIQNKNNRLGRLYMFRDISVFKNVERLRAEFMSTVSHDLRDPLELIAGYLSMLSMVGILNEEQVSYVQKIEQNIEGISQMVSNLLDTERIAVGEGLRYEKFSISSLLEEIIRDFETRALQKKIEVVFKSEAADVVVEADRMLLHRAFYNLIDNAIKFSPRGETVDVELSQSGQNFKVSVRDRGAGIAPVDLPAIFDRQMISGKRAFGLGIVKSIVERHKGRVWVESELGLGSNFICEMPQKQSD